MVFRLKHFLFKNQTILFGIEIVQPFRLADKLVLFSNGPASLDCFINGRQIQPRDIPLKVLTPQANSNPNKDKFR